VIGATELHQLELYTELYRPLGVEHQLAFVLPAGPDRVLAIALSRGRRDYRDSERDGAERARPFLIQAYRNAIAYEVLRAALASDGHGRLTGPLLAAGLTKREGGAGDPGAGPIKPTHRRAARHQSPHRREST
jgi:hypothetical protein